MRATKALEIARERYESDIEKEGYFGKLAEEGLERALKKIKEAAESGRFDVYMYAEYPFDHAHHPYQPVERAVKKELVQLGYLAKVMEYGSPNGERLYISWELAGEGTEGVVCSNQSSK